MESIESYDRGVIRRLIEKVERLEEQRLIENPLRDRLARFLFVRDLDPLTEVPVAGVRPDIMEPFLPLYVEVKHYSEEHGNPGRRIQEAATQVRSSGPKFQGSPWNLREAWLVVFRRGGRLVQLPEMVRGIAGMNDSFTTRPRASRSQLSGSPSWSRYRARNESGACLTPVAAAIFSAAAGLEVTRTRRGPFRIRMQPTTRLYEATSGQKIAYEARQRRSLQDWMQFPVGAISYDDASAYVAWLGATGRVPGARLCTEVEWERAARGADARRFPHGNRLHPEDSSHDATYGKEVLAFGPDEVGSHPASSSPFGVEDLAGSVWEWTSSGPGHHATGAPFAVLRGGSWYQRAEASATMNRELPEASHRDQTVGLRVCADASPR